MARSTTRAHGSVLAIVLPLAAASAAAITLVMSSTTTTTTMTSTTVRHRLTAVEVRKWLVRAGLDPRALVVAGVPAGHVGNLVGGAVDYIAQNSLVMEQVDAAASLARNDVGRLEELVRSGQASPQEVQNLSARRAAHTEATAQLNTHVAGVFTSATGGLTPDARDALTTIKRNRDRGVPIEFTLSDRPKAAWVDLRDVLSTRGQAQRANRPVPARAAQTIANATSVASTAAAARLTAALPALQSAWNQAVNAAQGR